MSTPNYRVTLSYDRERKVFEAQAPELEHCRGEGGSRAEAVARLEEEIRAQVENMQAHGSSPPPPVDEAELPPELRVKLSHTLQRELLWQARQEGVEVEPLLAEMIAAGLEARRAVVRTRSGNRAHAGDVPHDNIGNTISNSNSGNPRGPGNRGYGARYNPLLDDRANFIEYVRNLEQNGQNFPARGGSGPGRDPRNRRRNGPPGGGGGGPGRGPSSSGGNGGNGGRT